MQAAVTEYSARNSERVRGIDTSLPVDEQARAYLAPWLATAGGDVICLVGMLSTDAVFLPEAVHRILKDFYRLHEAWLTRLLETAQAVQHKALPIRRRRSRKPCLARCKAGWWLRGCSARRSVSRRRRTC